MRRTRIMAVVLAAALAGCAAGGGDDCVGEACLSGPRCEADEDCDDGLVCNGSELCGTISRRCVSGIALDCDDGIECTDDQCREPDGSCTSVSRDSLCGAGEACTGIEGSGCLRSCAPGVTCDPIEACGCLPEQGCSYAASGAPTCGATGTSEHGEQCAAQTDCVAGAQCVPLGGPGSYAECRVLCRDDGDCPDDSECRVELAGITTRVCVRTCDLVTQAGCASASGCHSVGFPEAAAYADCIVRGDRPVGAACGTAGAVCRAGLICVTQETGSPICDRMCRADRDCAAGLRCVMLVTPIEVDGVEYGVCN